MTHSIRVKPRRIRAAEVGYRWADDRAVRPPGFSHAARRLSGGRRRPARHARGPGRRRSVQRRGHRHLRCWRSCTRSWRRGSRRWPTTSSTGTTRRRRRQGLAPQPSVPAELLHFVGEVEVVFGLWAIVLLVAITAHLGWDTATHYFNDTVNYTEPLFVVVIMALASTRPVVGFAEAALRRVASARRRHAGGVVAGDPDHRPGARVVHHRAGGDDDLRAAAGAPVLRPAARRRA